ncbi:MAG TPA: C25 family cysteine peptidase, partial [Candidatus Krumholzibacteria bacterium]|nr:C25 family cysteine peptidase [Candidatus Krumholzibacteria bacterium]
MMKSRSVLLALGAALVMACAAAAEDAPRTIVLDPTQAAGEPTWQLLADKAGGPVVQVAIGAVDVRGVEMDGTAFSEVTIAGGELQGAPGRPALPVISRLVAVPEGMTVRVRNVAQRTTTLDGAWLPVPAQDLQAANAPLLWDRAWYSDKAAADAAPAAEVGAPARLHGVRVVPLTLHPVAWDRTDGTLKAATSLEIDLEYVPSAEAPARTTADRPLPASFATLLEQTVLGFDKSSVTTVPLGTWACIMPGDLAVQAAVQPLLEWRARQGYNVVVASTTDIGTSNTAIKAWLQDQYDTLKTPLEMVCLVGDADGSVAVASWRESLSGYSGEGDHPYTQLDGPDVL